MRRSLLILVFIAGVNADKLVYHEGKYHKVVSAYDSLGKEIPSYNWGSTWTPKKHLFKRQLNDKDGKDPMDRCIPLISKNPEANIYHDRLTGKPGVTTRVGRGIPIRLIENYKCGSAKPNYSPESQSCKLTISRSNQRSFTRTSGISFGSSVSVADTVGMTTSVGIESSYSRTITNAFEQNVGSSLSFEDNGSISNTVSNCLTSGHESAVSKNKGKSVEKQMSNTSNWDKSEVEGWSKEKGSDESNTIGKDVKKGIAVENRKEKSSATNREDTRGGHVETSHEFHTEKSDERRWDHTDNRNKEVTDETNQSNTSEESTEISKARTWNEAFGRSSTTSEAKENVKSATEGTANESSNASTASEEKTVTEDPGMIKTALDSVFPGVADKLNLGGGKVPNVFIPGSEFNKNLEELHNIGDGRQAAPGKEPVENNNTPRRGSTGPLDGMPNVGSGSGKSPMPNVGTPGRPDVDMPYGSTVKAPDANAGAMPEKNWDFQERPTFTDPSDQSLPGFNDKDEEILNAKPGFVNSDKEFLKPHVPKIGKESKEFLNGKKEFIPPKKRHHKRSGVALAGILGSVTGAVKDLAGSKSNVSSSSKANTKSASQTKTRNDMDQNSHSVSAGEGKNHELSNGGSNGLTKGSRRSKTSGSRHAISVGVGSSDSKGGSQVRSSGERDTKAVNKNWATTIGKTNTSTESESITESKDVTDSSSNTKTKTYREGANGSKTVTFGGSESITDGHTENDSIEKRISDTISQAYTAGVERGRGWSSGKSFNSGNSATDSDAKTESVTKDKHVSHEVQRQNIAVNNNEKSFSVSETYTMTEGVDFEVSIPAGACRYVACAPIVKSLVVPWKCANDKGEQEWVNSEVQEYVLNDGKVQCDNVILTCHSDQSAYSPSDEQYDETLTLGNSFMWEKAFNADSVITSMNKQYELKFIEAEGGVPSRLVVLHMDNKIKWETGLVNLGGDNSEGKPKETRLIITDNGHLIQEAKNIFREGYNVEDEWILVWSSLPMQLDYTVGMNAKGNKGYVLTIQDNGELVLRDSSSVIIWSTEPNNVHRLGYKYPVEYGIPTDYETEKNAQGQIDPHNQIPVGIMNNLRTELKSRDVTKDCGPFLQQNQGIKSLSGRFTLYLSPTGNLILKDKTRTMWSTKTANMDYVINDSKYRDGKTKPAYRMVLDESGNLFVRDERNRIIWVAYNVGDTKSGPYRAMVSEEGSLVIVDSNNLVQWNNAVLPIADREINTRSEAIWFDSPRTICADIEGGCQECEKMEDPLPLINLSNGKCLSMNGVSDCNGSDKQLWYKDTATGNYRSYVDKSMCVGGDDGNIVSKCSPDNAWKHVDNEPMVLFSNVHMCLSPDGKTEVCANPRWERLWSFGRNQYKEMTTDNNIVLMAGVDFVSGKSKINLSLKGDVTVTDSNNRKVSLVSSAKIKSGFKGPYYVVVDKDSSLSMYELTTGKKAWTCMANKKYETLSVVLNDKGTIVLSNDGKNVCLHVQNSCGRYLNY